MFAFAPLVSISAVGESSRLAFDCCTLDSSAPPRIRARPLKTPRLLPPSTPRKNCRLLQPGAMWSTLTWLSTCRLRSSTNAPRISAPAPDPAPVVSSPSRSSSESNGILRGGKGGGKRRADSTDAVASFLTRRFGLAGGLAWLGILTFGVVSEQLKTRREVREATENTRDVKDAEARVSASGVVFTELKIGGGERPKPGYLVAADVLATVEGTGAVLVDTKRQRRQLVFTYGRAQGPITRGVTEMVGEMNQGGRRVFDVPPSLGFGAEGATLADGSVVPPNATIRYDVELTRVSVPPS